MDEGPAYSPVGHQTAPLNDRNDHDSAKNQIPQQLPFDSEHWTINPNILRTAHQSESAAVMQMMLGRLLAHLLPLTTLRFGSRMSPRPINRLHEAIPKSQFLKFFQEYGSYANLANSLCSQWEDHGTCLSFPATDQFHFYFMYVFP
jgi:hypothetical protein